jgi:predicted N-acyltransferase
LVPGGDPLLPLLADRGYQVGLLSCTNLLAVRWPSFSAYLADRSSAKRRNILRGLHRSEQAGVAVAIRRGAAVGADLGLLAALAAGTAAHHGSPLFFDERFLTGILHELGEAVVVFTVRAGDVPLLACLALEHAGELTPWCVGLDYAGLDTFDQYNFLYAALIRHAIDSGLVSVNFGRSTYVIKRKFGCVQRPVRLAVRPAAGTAEWVRDIDQRARTELAAVGLPGRAA